MPDSSTMESHGMMLGEKCLKRSFVGKGGVKWLCDSCITAVLWGAGQERVIPLPTEAAQSAKASNDVLRYLKEGVTALKVDFKDVQASSEDETILRVRP